jgi:hypothetical protein
LAIDKSDLSGELNEWKVAVLTLNKAGLAIELLVFEKGTILIQTDVKNFISLALAPRGFLEPQHVHISE